MREGIITGEGVIIDARPASFATRLLASAVDIILLIAVIIAVIAVLPDSPIPAGYEAVFAIVTLVTITVVIPTTVETLSRGMSLGKLLTGTRIVRDDGGPVRFRHAFIRALVGVGELYLTVGSVAGIASLSNVNGKRVGDMLAGTYSIRVRGTSSEAAELFMPPQLANWAVHADMRRLPDGLALAVRQYLGRAHRLAPESRVRLGMSLAAEVEAFVAPGAPQGTPPEAFLMAVLTERREREWVSAQRERELAQEQARLIHRLPFEVYDPVS